MLADKNKDEDWSVDQQLISKLKEQYKQERTPKGKKPAQIQSRHCYSFYAMRNFIRSCD